MLWARRGESWKQKHLTWYPSSLNVAAAEAPARPLPTTSTVYFRLLAGFTSFISNRWRSHFCSIGPAGVLDRSSIALVLDRSRFGDRRLPQEARVDGDRDHAEPEPDRDGERESELPLERPRRR